MYGNNYPRPRSPSPLRSSFRVDPNTGGIQSDDGSDDNNDEDPDATWGRRSHSPNPSISQFASSFAQRVGSFVSTVGSSAVSSSGLPTEEELEREAERDRERSRREAERILTREAEERRLEEQERNLMEEKVLAMLNTTHATPKQISPARSQSMPSFETPSPTLSQRDSPISSWWSAAKNRLTPTKEPLTAAQQVIQDTKEKEKREKKEAKKVEKDRKRSVDWPAVPENKFTNPTLLSLATPPKPSSKGSSLSAPPSPTPGAQGLPSSLPPSLAPSPLRTPDSRNSPSRSPSREPPPLYTQFTDQGSLDVPGTLLVIARRFEKLEKWTVGHVRALEDRMGDVERWLVDKESEKEGEGGEGTLRVNESSSLEGTVNQMRDELMEMQGRIGELGREMAKYATSPGILSTMPSRVSAQAVSTAPQTNSSFAIHAQTSSSITVHSHSLPPNTPPSVSRISSYSDLRRRDSVSPPFIPPSAIRAEQPRSRLPYPSGDYASPPGSVTVAHGALSPPRSPPTSSSASASPAGLDAVLSRPTSVAGLPAPTPPPPASAPAGLPPSQMGGTLVAPPHPPARARSSSISPTPRKRYTVALGEPIMKPRISASPPPISVGDDDDDDDDDDAEEEDVVDRTIGRSAGRHAAPQQRRSNGVGLGFGFGPGMSNGNGYGNGEDTDTSMDSVPRARPPRPRPHSSRTPSSAQSAASVNASASASATGGRMSSQRLLGHGRALSIDRAAAAQPRTRTRSSTSTTPSTPASAASSSGRFRDPLVVRREEHEARAKAVPPPPKVVSGKPRAPVGELVAYFDKS